MGRLSQSVCEFVEPKLGWFEADTNESQSSRFFFYLIVCCHTTAATTATILAEILDLILNKFSGFKSCNRRVLCSLETPITVLWGSETVTCPVRYPEIWRRDWESLVCRNSTPFFYVLCMHKLWPFLQRGRTTRATTGPRLLIYPQSTIFSKLSWRTSVPVRLSACLPVWW